MAATLGKGDDTILSGLYAGFTSEPRVTPVALPWAGIHNPFGVDKISGLMIRAAGATEYAFLPAGAWERGNCLLFIYNRKLSIFDAKFG
jgi:hypothetical protein